MFFSVGGISLHAQSVRVIETLKKLEMENISVVEKSDTITAAFETSVYRGAYNGIGIAIRHLVAMPEMPTLQLVILDNALPQLCITLRQNWFNSISPVNTRWMRYIVIWR